MVKPTTIQPEKRKLKVLMLHGYTQSGPLFHAKTRAHAKLLAKAFPTPGIDLIYPTGPHLLLPPDIPGYNPESPPSKAYGWWIRETGGEKYKGLEEGLQTIADAIREVGTGGIDGVIGFSQGAAGAAFVASLLEDGREDAFASNAGGFEYPESFRLLKKEVGQRPLKFAVSYSGFLPPSSLYKGFFEPKIKTPFLNVIGSLDSVVDESRSVALAESCEEGKAKVVYHPGGHFVPIGKEMSGVLVGFIRECIEEKKEEKSEEGVEDMDVPF